MAKLSEIRATTSKLSQRINLKELLGSRFKGDKATREKFAQAVIDFIVERTESGASITGEVFKGPYSEEYQDSLEFKAAGKKPNEVNLKLTGDMLRSIDVIGQTKNTITIGIDDPDEAAKAYNHQVGDTVPRRAFFGITPEDVEEIAERFASGES